ncbi:MAG: 4Fe-4S binding protein [Chloroflexota bacterium]|nr:4Fe-4S binding protein [Anaerolineae bacterium]
MADLRVEICGISFPNPVWPAPGPPVRDGAAMEACAEGGAGALVSKTVSVKPAEVPTPNMAEIKGGFLNTELWSEIPVEQWLEVEYAKAKATGLPLIIGLGYSADDIRNLAPRVAPFADGLELSTHYIGENPEPMMNAIRAAKEAVDVPIFVKLSPLGREMVAAAQAAQEAGADAIVAINSFGPCLGIDAETGLPLMGSESGYGWLSGPAIKPLALRCVMDIVREVDLPVIGVGGVSRGIDVIEMFMVGASAVQLCTASILKGPQVFGKIVAEADKWLDEHGYDSIEQIRGLTLRKLAERQVRTYAIPPVLDVEKCTGCRLCEISCGYDAIHVVDEKAVLNTDACAGCGLCVTRCRPGALTMPD